MKAALRTGFHDPKSDIMENHFSAHCCRHWFTAYLIRAGMPRDFVKELRGDRCILFPEDANPGIEFRKLVKDMKVIAFNGSPRKNGNTATLLEEALEGAFSQGSETPSVRYQFQGLYELLCLQSQGLEELWTLCCKG
jgi:hypothetical protein